MGDKICWFKSNRKATQNKFLAAITTILEDQGAYPETINQEGGDTSFDASSIHHQSLRAASIGLLRTVAKFQTSLKEIKEKEMAFGKSWEQEIHRVEAEIKEMAEKTEQELVQFFESNTGGWRIVADGWEKRVTKLLKGAPVLREDDGE